MLILIGVYILEDLKTKEYVNECFDYKDGILYWKFRPLHHFTSESNQKRFNSIWVGKEAGYVNYRTDAKRVGFAYHRVRLWGKLQKTHRVIFLMFHGHLPDLVDHIDNDPLNNKIENLRESDLVRNARNSGTNYNKTTKGVQKSKTNRTNKFIAVAYPNNKSLYIGHFPTESEAQAAYNLACIQLGFEDFRPVATNFIGNVRKTKFFENNNFSTEYPIK